MLDQPGLSSADAGGLSGLTEILTGKSGRQQIDFRERCEVGDIADVRDARESRFEHSRGRTPVFGEQRGFMPRLAQSEFEAADPRE